MNERANERTTSSEHVTASSNNTNSTVFSTRDKAHLERVEAEPLGNEPSEGSKATRRSSAALR
jgi:hypothetical protein